MKFDSLGEVTYLLSFVFNKKCLKYRVGSVIILVSRLLLHYLIC